MVKMSTTKPEAEPIVGYSGLNNTIDIYRMIACISFSRPFFASKVLAPYNLADKEQLMRYVRAQYSPQGWHPIGAAAKMQRAWGGVVDDELRAYGV